MPAMTCTPGASERSASSVTTRLPSNALGRAEGRLMLRGQSQFGVLARAARVITAGVLILLFTPYASAVQRTQFDHLTTGYELRGFHRDLSCEYCHLQGVFKGTPRTCVGCHTAGSRGQY